MDTCDRQEHRKIYVDGLGKLIRVREGQARIESASEAELPIKSGHEEASFRGMDLISEALATAGNVLNGP